MPPPGADSLSKVVRDAPLDFIRDHLLIGDLELVDTELVQARSPMRPYLNDEEAAYLHAGKRLRPMVMLLSARMIAGDAKLGDKAIRGAAALEMLHVATLIHDDIVDDAELRRGAQTLSARRGTKQALLIGDLQFVQALRTYVGVVETDSDIALVARVLDTAFDICCGELDELETDMPDDPDAGVAHYFRTIDRKTAVLFELACQSGVELGGGRTHEARRAGFFGKALGRSFQIMDDILDLIEDGTSAGKTPGQDLLQGRRTLPLIYGLDLLPASHPVPQALRGGPALTVDQVPGALSDLRDCGAIDRAYADARRAALGSLFYLKPFAASAYRDALHALAMHVVNRPLRRPTLA